MTTCLASAVVSTPRFVAYLFSRSRAEVTMGLSSPDPVRDAAIEQLPLMSESDSCRPWAKNTTRVPRAVQIVSTFGEQRALVCLFLLGLFPRAFFSCGLRGFRTRPFLASLGFCVFLFSCVSSAGLSVVRAAAGTYVAAQRHDNQIRRVGILQVLSKCRKKPSNCDPMNRTRLSFRLERRAGREKRSRWCSFAFSCNTGRRTVGRARRAGVGQPARVGRPLHLKLSRRMRNQSGPERRYAGGTR